MVLLTVLYMKAVKYIVFQGVGKMKKTAENINRDFALPERVFEIYADTVYRLAFVRTKNISDSEDILQEVFLRYLKIWEKMENEEHVKAMLIRITVNCSNSLNTSSWFKKTTALDDNIPYFDSYNESTVLNEVLKLPQKYRTAIHLYYYCDYSVNDIAKILKSKPSTVKTHLNRGRAMLKETLKADEL